MRLSIQIICFVSYVELNIQDKRAEAIISRQQLDNSFVQLISNRTAIKAMSEETGVEIHVGKGNFGSKTAVAAVLGFTREKILFRYFIRLRGWGAGHLHFQHGAHRFGANGNSTSWRRAEWTNIPIPDDKHQMQ